MRRRVNLRAYPRELQGIAISRAQLDAVQRLIETSLDMRNAHQRPLIDLLAEAYMLGVNSVAAQLRRDDDPGRPVPPHGSGP